MIAALILAGALVGWPQPSAPTQGSPASSYHHWAQPDPGQDVVPWPFYGDPLVGPRDVVCWPVEWIYIGRYRALYPGVCWSRRAYRRHRY